jgi:catechol 2,3-dioxygenase-like lactoylglutathione lyase family enzyme
MKGIAFRNGASMKLRVARPTDNMADIIRFYRDGLGMQILASFDDHNGFDGVMLGHPHSLYHLEFTHHRGHKAGKAPTQDNLLVFYIPNVPLWEEAVSRLQSQGFNPVKSYNPYWDEKGKTFEDADGYRVVLQNAGWEL